MKNHSEFSRFPARVVLIWLLVAIALGATGMLRRFVLPPPAIALGLTTGLLLAYWFSRPFKQGVRTFSPRALVLFHLTRLAAGIYFLVLFRRGILPGEFALVAGWGDIVVGLGAIVTAWTCFPIRNKARRVGLLVWNAVGLADILLVLSNALRIFLPNPAVAEPFSVLPLAILPMFVVPSVIFSHLVLFGSAGRQERPAS